jgi:hypothetical protein
MGPRAPLPLPRPLAVGLEPQSDRKPGSGELHPLTMEAGPPLTKAPVVHGL